MHKGFSLIEMLVALSLMVLLASFVIPNVLKYQNKSYQLASEVNIRTFQSAVESYYLDNNAYPVGNMNISDLFSLLKTGEYLTSSPTNPYYKAAYSSSQTKGKILYSSTSGDDYALTLYGGDGQTVQITLGRL
ncbi:MAG: prepilin-type N-terminal cleavage/methylation domain-containing protein [Candidatus Margulisiibacteriota bacterium]